jgi:hypothetical protein
MVVRQPTTVSRRPTGSPPVLAPVGLGGLFVVDAGMGTSSRLRQSATSGLWPFATDRMNDVQLVLSADPQALGFP